MGTSDAEKAASKTRRMFGRRVIKTSAKSITADNVLDVLGKALAVHAANRSEIDYLWNYYKGDQPALYRTKEVRPEICNQIVENHANEIVRFKVGYAWCDVFVDWCFFKAFGKTEGQLVECQTGTLGAACPYSAGYYKALGRYDKTPRVGDQVFFQQGGELVHTGVVVGVSGGTVTCVEGNASNMVKQTSYSITNSYVAGFGHPRYTEDPAPAPEPMLVGVSVQLPVLQQGVSGSAAVKTVQRILYARNIRDDAGKVVAVDGSFGASTRQAVVKLQKSLFPGDSSQWDGEVGGKTWSAMLTELW